MCLLCLFLRQTTQIVLSYQFLDWWIHSWYISVCGWRSVRKARLLTLQHCNSFNHLYSWNPHSHLQWPANSSWWWYWPRNSGQTWVLHSKECDPLDTHDLNLTSHSALSVVIQLSSHSSHCRTMHGVVICTWYVFCQVWYVGDLFSFHPPWPNKGLDYKTYQFEFPSHGN